MLCQECKKKPTCKSLCAAAEQYVNQDYTPQNEVIPKSKAVDYVLPLGASWPDLSTRSTEENIISLFFKGGVRQAKVAESLNVSRQFVSKIIKKHREIMRENLKKQVDSVHK